MTVADETETSIQVTCWGSEVCEHIVKVQVGTILLLSQCRVSEYCGRSINSSSEPKDILIFKETDKPLLDRQKVIKEWYSNFDSITQI